MSTPSEPGWYWWRASSTARWQPARVTYSGPPGYEDAHFWVKRHDVLGDDRLDSLGGEWGLRIPSPEELAVLYAIRDADTRGYLGRPPSAERLEAMEELAADDPATCISSDYDDYGCHYCSEPVGRGGKIKHAPDCPWKRAQPQPRVVGTGVSLAVIDVTREEWDAMSESEREECQRLTERLCGEEKPNEHAD